MPKIRHFEAKDQNQVTRLFCQLTEKAVIFEADDMLADSNVHALVAVDENDLVQGFASLITYRTPIHGQIARVEDVVVDNACRGRGLGKLLMNELLNIAKEKGVSRIELASNPTRVAAQNLYKSLGFKKKETEVFQLELK